jgi:hypothetical protein
VRVLLADVALYEAGIDFAEGSAVAIAMRVSWQDRDVSLNLIKDVNALIFVFSLTEFNVNVWVGRRAIV